MSSGSPLSEKVGAAVIALIAWAKLFLAGTGLVALPGVALFLILGRTTLAWVVLSVFLVAGLTVGVRWAERVRRRGESDLYCGPP